MSTQNNKRKLDAYRPTFDPGLDIMTAVFSHVRCVKTRDNLALVSDLWGDASTTAAAYPLRFDWGGFPDMDGQTRLTRFLELMDNDEALSLPYERVVGLLGATANSVCYEAARRGSVRLLKWTRVNNLDWGAGMCSLAAEKGHLPALKYLHENGCPWDSDTCWHAAHYKHWDYLKYAVDNKCPEWEIYAKKYLEHLR